MTSRRGIRANRRARRHHDFSNKQTGDRSYSRTLQCESLEDRILLTAVRDLPGFAANTLPAEPNASSGAVDLGFEIDFFGTRYNEIFVNENGNVTFGEGLGTPNGFNLSDLTIPMIAANWTDVLTADGLPGRIRYGTATVEQRPAFGVVWDDVRWTDSSDASNTFEIILVDRSDVVAGAFDLELNYDQVTWDLSQILGDGTPAPRAGFSAGGRGGVEPGEFFPADPGTFYELIGSGTPGAFLESNESTSLVGNSLRSLEAGRYLFEFRDGTSLNQLGLAGQFIEITPDVLFLGEGTHPFNLVLEEEPTNIDSIDTSDADRVRPGGSLGTNLTGAGVTVGVVEARERPGNTFDAAGNNTDALGNFLTPSGFVRVTHNDLTGRITTPGAAPTLFSDHATHVAGTVGGNGPANRQGFAPAAQIQSFEAGAGIGITQAQANNLDITNHSYGQGGGWGSTIQETQIVAGNVQNFAASDINGDGDTMDNIDLWLADRTLGSEDPRFGVYSTLDATRDDFLANNPGLLSIWTSGNHRDDVFSNSITTGQYVAFFSGGVGGGAAGWYIVPSAGNAATNAPGSDGNNGTGFDSISFGSTTKNTIVVGAINDINIESTDLMYEATLATDLTVGFSSYGPLDDGRLGVDLVANGASLISSGARSDTDQVPKSGTSMAAPSVAGTAALQLEHYRNLAGAPGNTLPNANPTAATQKAILIHSARDLFTDGPDYSTGYGVVQADAAVQLISSSASTSPIVGRQDRIIEDTFTAAQPARTFTLHATPGQDVEATLVWTDPAGNGQQVQGVFPGNPPNIPLDAPTPALVNDLNLTITGPDGAVFRPWVLNPNTPAAAATTGVNTTDNIENIRFVASVGGTYTVSVGTANGNLSSGASQNFSLVLSANGDALEDNDTIETATVLGSIPQITLNDLSIHDESDVDFLKVTANETGKLIVNAFFDHSDGDLSLRIVDASGATIAESTSNTDDEQVIIPVVGQEMYFVLVVGEEGAVNNYALEIENFAAPVPSGIHLDPDSDTGMDPMDLKTADNTPRIVVQADLQDFESMFAMNPTPNPSGVIDSNGVAGADVQVHITGLNTGTSIIGNAARVGTTTLWTFTPAAPLVDDVYFVSAAVTITDGQTVRVTGRTQLSEPIWLTIDTTAPTLGGLDLLPSSDTGMDMEDNVTNKMSPAFDGLGEANAKVRVFAELVAPTAFPRRLVGEGVVNSDASDGFLGTGLGIWEVTVEPLADGIYNFTVDFEDMAGNIGTADTSLTVEIDTLAPNTPFLDLVEADDSGRHNDDNITNVDSPLFSATTHDPNAGIHLFAENFKYRIFDRLESSNEIELYDSFGLVGFTALTQIFTTANLANGNTILGPLADGIHNLKLEVEDRAGNISHDFLLDVLIDTEAPDGTLNLHPDSDTGIWGFVQTMEDLVTSDKTPSLFGSTEANALVRADIDGDAAGTAVAIPLDGDDAFQPPAGFVANYALDTVLNLDNGEHTITAFFQDVAGNETAAADAPTLTIFLDTSGPRITNVTRGQVSTDNVFSNDGITSLFEPKPSETGPDPLIHSIIVHFSDLPDRTQTFANVPALFQALASEEGNYRLVGDHNGNISIVDVNVTFTTTPGDGEPEQAEVELVFAAPLPDDRFTFWVSDAIADPAGNPLDGESGAQAPFDGNNVPGLTPPIFPTGDGAHGGEFHGRFTVDSRAEIGVWSSGSVWVDTNGNFSFDPDNVDATNRDIVYAGIGFTSDDVFAGNFPAAGGGPNGYDKLAAYGKVSASGGYRWLIDTDDDGVLDTENFSPDDVNGLPAAGNFDADPEDELVVFDGTTWHIYDIVASGGVATVGAVVAGNLIGLPMVGDFDGDGTDDFGTYNETLDQFEIDLTGDAVADLLLPFGFPGVRERPAAGDIDADGIDDIGLYAPNREGPTPAETAEWYFLVSGGSSILTRANTSGISSDFRPIPFGNDVFAQFGDEFTIPIVGNFDPPLSLNLEATQRVFTNASNPLDINGDGIVTPRDALLIINYLNKVGPTGVDQLPDDAAMLDSTGDNFVSPRDALWVINALSSSPPTGSPGTLDSDAPIGPSEADVAHALLGDDDDDPLFTPL